MKNFLSEVVEDLLKQKSDFRQTTLIIPGVRPKAFLRKTFVENGFSGMLPQMKTIEEFLEEITGLKLISGVPLLFSTYEAHLKTAHDKKSFEDFLKYSNILLKDFDDIDASLCDDKALLDNLISEERIRKWGQSMDIGLSEIMKNHLGFWTDAQTTFYTLRQNLLEEGKAYRGLLVKKASEEVKRFILKNQTHQYIYIGFNALTHAEFKILSILLEEKRAKSYWDSDEYYMNNPHQEAGDFLRKYRQKFPDEFKTINRNFVKEKSLKIVSVPKQETQAKYVGNVLKNLSKEDRENTAIVLADEQLLPAILNALPSDIDKLNITMGLPLQMIPISNFFKDLFDLHLSREKYAKKDVYYYQIIIKLLQDPNFRSFFHPQAEQILKEIHEQNFIFVSKNRLEKLKSENLYFSLFDYPSSVSHLMDIVTSWINLLYESEDIPEMIQEYLFRFRSIFMQLKDLVDEHDFIDNYKVLFHLYQQLLSSESVSFVGEPLVGLQLLGMLETRLLDFKNIILTSVNEGTLPLGRQENSFIPFDFRVESGLNTFLDNDAIYAYHFYRLIQRCKSAVMLYNADTEGTGTGEASRFLLQLDLESPHEIKKEFATPIYKKISASLNEIKKSKAVVEKLNFWKNKISPSSLSSYLYDPIQFYSNYILRIRQEEEVREIADDMTLGNIVHNTLNEVYLPYLNQKLTDYHFKEIDLKKDIIFKKVVEKILLKNHEASGKNIIILRVAREMIENVLKKDKSFAASNELIIRSLECQFQRTFTTPNEHEVNFFGYIDRIDEANGVTRVLDYKTGSVYSDILDSNEAKVEKLIDDYKGGQVMQLAIYAYMMNQEYIQSGIYPLRYFSKDLEFLKFNKNELLTHESIQPIMLKIGDLIDEILNPEISFHEPEPVYIP